MVKKVLALQGELKLLTLFVLSWMTHVQKMLSPQPIR